MMKKITLFIFLLTAGFGYAQDLVMTVTVPAGTTSCRFSGAFWSASRVVVMGVCEWD